MALTCVNAFRACRRFLVGNHSANVACIALASAMFLSFQLSSATEPLVQSNEPNAGSVLDSTRRNGRIGGFNYDGSLKPTPGISSRFTNDAKYGGAGNVVGVDQSSSASRFQSGIGQSFQSKMDYGLLMLRNEERRELLSREFGEAMEKSSNEPRLVTARKPSKIPYPLNRRPRYGKSYAEDSATPPEVVLKDAWRPDEASLAGKSNPDANESSGDLTRLWMRGQIPQNTGQIFDPWGNAYGRRDMNDAASTEPSYDVGGTDMSFWGGALSLPDGNIGGAISFPRVAPTPEEAERAFREYLEAQLLRSPDVNPLSPVQVDYSDGVATIRGIVPNPSARLAAGKILLADPRVTRVNNLMTCVRDDEHSLDAVQDPSLSEQSQKAP